MLWMALMVDMDTLDYWLAKPFNRFDFQVAM